MTGVGQEFDPRLRSPCNIIVAGPPKSGKTHLVLTMIQDRRDLWNPPLGKVVYCYGEWQPAFDPWRDRITFVEGIPANLYDYFEGETEGHSGRSHEPVLQ